MTVIKLQILGNCRLTFKLFEKVIENTSMHLIPCTIAKATLLEYQAEERNEEQNGLSEERSVQKRSIFSHTGPSIG